MPSDLVRMPRKIWIVLPAFNEEDALPVLLPQLDRALREHGAHYRMVVVDDGSTDRTGAILASLSETLPIDVLRHPINRGLGETERDAFEFVSAHCDRHDVVVRVEGDNTHGPEYVFRLLDKLDEGYDVVNTSRFQPGGGQLGVSAYRACVSRAANIFMKGVFWIPNVRDYSCGFRAYRASAIQDAIDLFGNNFIQLKGMGFTSTLEMLVKLNCLGCRFAEVPFVLRYDLKTSSSKMVTNVTALGYLMMALLYHWPFGGWRRRYRGRRSEYRRGAGSASDRLARDEGR
jgi:dolichol-phosphate mannosyltransferase